MPENQVDVIVRKERDQMKSGWQCSLLRPTPMVTPRGSLGAQFFSP